MTKKHLIIFVVLLFGLIITLLILRTNENAQVYNEIQQARLSDLAGVQFYKDLIRDETGINKAIADEDLEDLLAALKTIKKSNITLKSLNYEATYKIQLNLKVADTRLLTINVHRTEEYGDTGIVTINEGETLVASRGTYTSPELLEWIENMKERDEYKGL
jgi:hypothetical protein